MLVVVPSPAPMISQKFEYMYYTMVWNRISMTHLAAASSSF